MSLDGASRNSIQTRIHKWTQYKLNEEIRALREQLASASRRVRALQNEKHLLNLEVARLRSQLAHQDTSEYDIGSSSSSGSDFSEHEACSSDSDSSEHEACSSDSDSSSYKPEPIKRRPRR